MIEEEGGHVKPTKSKEIKYNFVKFKFNEHEFFILNKSCIESRLLLKF